MVRFRLSLLVLSLGLLGCPSTTDPVADADPTPEPTPDPNVCHADALADDVPYGTDLEELQGRWNRNSEVVRALFVGEPL